MRGKGIISGALAGILLMGLTACASTSENAKNDLVSPKQSMSTSSTAESVKPITDDEAANKDERDMQERLG